MTRRSRLLIVVLASVAVSAARLGGQAPAGAARVKQRAAPGWTPPIGPDGHPDFQGVWLNNSATPLERPKALEGRTTLTDDEVARLREHAARLFTDTDFDFAAGDAVFLAALAGADTFRSATSTGTTSEMIERDFDNRTSLIVDPPDGRIPPLTPEALERRARAAERARRPYEGPEDLTQVERCVTYGTPRLSGASNAAGAGPLGYYQIVQTPSYVLIFLEAIHEARLVRLDGQAHPPAPFQQSQGDSRGHWEGTTLVIDTTNFSTRNNFMGSAEHLHLVERLTRVAENRLDYTITIEDPTTWTKPWTAVVRLKPSTEKLYEYACHEGNTEIVRNMLLGARARDGVR